MTERLELIPSEYKWEVKTRSPAERWSPLARLWKTRASLLTKPGYAMDGDWPVSVVGLGETFEASIRAVKRECVQWEAEDAARVRNRNNNTQVWTHKP